MYGWAWFGSRSRCPAPNCAIDEERTLILVRVLGDVRDAEEDCVDLRVTVLLQSETGRLRLHLDMAQRPGPGRPAAPTASRPHSCSKADARCCSNPQDALLTFRPEHATIPIQQRRLRFLGRSEKRGGTMQKSRWL